MRENDSTQKSNRESKYWARVQAEMLSETLKMREAVQKYTVLELNLRDGDDLGKWRVPGILQARTVEWVAISSSNA